MIYKSTRPLKQVLVTDPNQPKRLSTKTGWVYKLQTPKPNTKSSENLEKRSEAADAFMHVSSLLHYLSNASYTRNKDVIVETAEQANILTGEGEEA